MDSRDRFAGRRFAQEVEVRFGLDAEFLLHGDSRSGLNR